MKPSTRRMTDEKNSNHKRVLVTGGAGFLGSHFCDRLVVDRWLPAVGLGDRCAPLLATAAARQGRWVWQLYEDLGDETLDRCPERTRVESAVDLVAELHTRAAGHPLLPEVRH
jgi:nucleoside-diphosphate-sugar epimerase